MDIMPRENAKRAARLKHPLVPYDEDGSESRPQHSESFRKILSLLHRLQKHPLAGPFLQPVDLNAVPDYLEVVKEPIDLSMVEDKLMSGGYTSAYEFSADVRKMWSNAFTYNAQNTEIYNITVTLSAFFESIFKGNENLLLTDRHDAIEGLYKQLEALKKEIKDIKGNKQPAPKALADRPMTLQEKKVLGQNIRALQPQYLRGLIAIIKDSLPKDIQGTELEFDLDTLSPKVCRELERYVKQCMSTSVTSTKSHPKKKPAGSNGSYPSHQVQDVNERLEEMAIGSLLPQNKDSESESSSSSDSEEAEQPTGIPPLGMDDMFGGSEYSSMWPNYQQQRGPSDHQDGYMMDFDHA